MPRRKRRDEQGALYHVFNRAIARRTMFENRADFRFFLSLLARSVHRGEIEVHAYCLLHTHYHLLIRVRAESLARVMQRIQTNYSRHFNRRRRRDGPLARGRFSSKRVDDPNYEVIVRRYIERNPCDAGITPRPEDYEFGSAARRDGPDRALWISTRSAPPTLSGSVESKTIEDQRFVVTRRLAIPVEEEEPEDFLARQPARIAEWMGRKATLADGTRPGLASCAPSAVEAAVAEARAALESIPRPPGIERLRRLDLHVSSALLRSLCGLTYAEIGRRSGRSRSAASDSTRRFSRLLAASPELREIVENIIRSACGQSGRGTTAERRGTANHAERT